MHQFVQSAIEAAKQGDNNKALAFIKQVLNASPDDVDAWLVLAAIVEDPQRKRQCLKRVLALDPVNQLAREEMLEMDRNEMGGTVSAFTEDPLAQPPEKPAPVSKPKSQPKPIRLEGHPGEDLITKPAPQQATRVTLQEWPEETPQPASPKPQPSSKARTEKPQVFKYPLFWRILMYAFVVIFGCGGLVIATQNIVSGLFFLGLAFLMLLMALAFSPTVEVSGKGIRASGMFSSAETGWDEIVKMKSNAMKRRLELTRNNGEVVNVSTQVSGYPQIVEIVRKRRPDLFGMASSASTSALGSDHLPSASYGNAPASSFTGTKVFKKGLFAQYGVILLMIPLCIVGGWFVTTSDDKFVGIGIGLIGLFFMVMSLFSINQVKLEPNKLIIETFFGEKEYTAKEIKEITMKTVRSRHGIASNFVNVQPMKGGAISLAGFPDGDEIIYGVLHQWWDTHRNG